MVAVLTPKTGGKPIVIDKAVVLIGRHPDCDYILQNSRKVSRRHLCIVQVDDRYLVRDLGSMNGIWVNGIRVSREHPITLGDELSVGDVVFRFEEVQKIPRQPKQKAPSPEPDGNGDLGQMVTPAKEIDLSQQYAVPIPDEDESFAIIEEDDDSIPLKALSQEVPELKPLAEEDDSDASGSMDEEESLVQPQEQEAEPEQLPEVRPLANSVEEFVPVMDVEETFDEQEIEEVILLDDEPEIIDDDDIVLLD